jgi:hypothetical protein
MKKITFVLFALIAGTGFAQDNANADAQVFAEIVSPISIENTRSLNFGRLIGSSGTVSIEATADGQRTGTGNVLAATGEGSTEPQSAKFEIKASNDYTFKVEIDAPEALVLGESSNSMLLTIEHDLLDGENQGNGATVIPMHLGGQLTVADGQEEGTYTGTINVTVSYE